MANYNRFLEINKGWDYMVTDHANNQNRDADENKKIWYDFLCDPAFFGYSRLYKEVLSGRKVDIGGQEISIPYFVVRDSVSKKDLFVLDVKKYDSIPEEQDVNQLKFCVRNFRVAYSVLICDKIYIYDRTNNAMDVSFTSNNSEGIRFIDMFSYNNLRPGLRLGPKQPYSNEISMSKAVALFIAKGFPLEIATTTFFSFRSSLDMFWNPKIDLRHDDRAIIFNDISTRRLYLALIPSNILLLTMVKIRADRPRYAVGPSHEGLHIKFEYGKFEDMISGVSFGGYIKEIIDY